MGHTGPGQMCPLVWSCSGTRLFAAGSSKWTYPASTMALRQSIWLGQTFPLERFYSACLSGCSPSGSLPFQVAPLGGKIIRMLPSALSRNSPFWVTLGVTLAWSSAVAHCLTVPGPWLSVAGILERILWDQFSCRRVYSALHDKNNAPHPNFILDDCQGKSIVSSIPTNLMVAC